MTDRDAGRDADPGRDTDPDSDAASPEERFARYGEELVDAVDAVLAGWVRAAVADRWRQFHRAEPTAEVEADAERAAARARAEIVSSLGELLRLDAEEQWTNPLALLRRAARYATEVLQRAGVPPVVRDRFAEQAFPDDVYDLVPASFADVDPSLHEPGLVWGAAKAHVVLIRRKGRPEQA
ncbi:MAG: hypothetical protein AB7W59_22525 [Acidimicrobiia bacterium]